MIVLFAVIKCIENLYSYLVSLIFNPVFPLKDYKTMHYENRSYKTQFEGVRVDVSLQEEIEQYVGILDFIMVRLSC